MRDSKGRFVKGTTVWNKGLKGWPQEYGLGFQKGHGYIGGGTPKGKRVSIKSEFKKGMIPWNKGVHGVMVAWNKGLRKREPVREIDHAKYAEWRDKVFLRDNYRCQWCGIRGYKLQADHYFSFAVHPKKRYQVNNGRTLCLSCHKKRTAKQLSVYWKNQFKESKHRSGVRTTANV